MVTFGAAEPAAAAATATADIGESKHVVGEKALCGDDTGW